MKRTNTHQRWLILLFLALVIQGCSTYQGAQSPHFDGTRFFNAEPDNVFLDHMKWLWEMKTVEWPEWIDDLPQPAPPAVAGDNALFITYINHATFLIQMDGINILTDPVWSDRAGPVSWLGTKRVRSPGVKLSELPKIDVILISHDHYDHLDIPTLNQLLTKDNPIILCGLGVEKRMTTLNPARIASMDWWQTYMLPDGRNIRFVSARHNSGRGLFDTDTTLWGGFVIESPAGHVLFMGDTAFGSCFTEIKKRYQGFRAAILPIGSYEKRWFMKTAHMNPDDAVTVHGMLNVQTSVGSHFATFNEHPEQTIDAHEIDLKAALYQKGISEADFLILKFGEGVKIRMKGERVVSSDG